MIGASEVLGLLANDVRRRLLLLLCEHESVRVPDAVLDRDPRSSMTETALDGLRSRSREHAALRLQHVHLPKLAEADVVEWHRERDVVARGPRFGDVEPMVAVLSENATRVPQEVF
ncbi:DUF7344 domain-containing protein [Halosimplex sp. J119]